MEDTINFNLENSILDLCNLFDKSIDTKDHLHFYYSCVFPRCVEKHIMKIKFY